MSDSYLQKQKNCADHIPSSILVGEKGNNPYITLTSNKKAKSTDYMKDV
jgi:hypothetical protein